MLVPNRRRKDVSTVQQLQHAGRHKVERVDQMGKHLAKVQILQYHLLGHRDAELFRAQKPQQKQIVRPHALDVTVLLQPIAQLFERLFPNRFVLAQFLAGDLHDGVRDARVLEEVTLQLFAASPREVQYHACGRHRVALGN